MDKSTCVGAVRGMLAGTARGIAGPFTAPARSFEGQRSVPLGRDVVRKQRAVFFPRLPSRSIEVPIAVGRVQPPLAVEPVLGDIEGFAPGELVGRHIHCRVSLS